MKARYDTLQHQKGNIKRILQRNSPNSLGIKKLKSIILRSGDTIRDFKAAILDLVQSGEILQTTNSLGNKVYRHKAKK